MLLQEIFCSIANCAYLNATEKIAKRLRWWWKECTYCSFLQSFTQRTPLSFFFSPAQWFQMVKIRHKIGLLVLVSRTFHRNSQPIYIILVSSDRNTLHNKNVSNCCSMTSQFPEFFNPIFGGFLLFGPTVSYLFHSPVVVRPPEKRKKMAWVNTV